MLRTSRSRRRFALALLAALFGAASARAQEGVVLTGVGPVNRSMGGASTAAPLDAAGALYWNPASITGLPRSEMTFGMELLFPHATVASSVPANALGVGLPPAAASGSDRSDSGIYPLPTFGLVYRTDEDSPWTLGVGVLTVGGFGANYPGSTTNPILQAPPLTGLGVGPIYSELTVVQLVPTVAYQVTDRLSVGIAPTVTLASLRLDPDILAAPDHPGGTPFVSYPRSAHAPISTGGGVQAGVFYAGPEGWQFGVSVKSPQWLQRFHFNSMTAQGVPFQNAFTLDYPMMVSAGVAYAGVPRWLFATDFRYIDYADADGFRQHGFAPDGSVQGLGWRSIFGVACGAQYQWTDALAVRGGYSYNQSPVARTQDTVSPQATITAAGPAILEHALYAGLTWRVNEALLLSVAYAHGFTNSVSGVYRGPEVIVPGSTVRTSASADAVVVGATVQFGPARR